MNKVTFLLERIIGNILFYSENPERNYKLSKTSFLFYTIFVLFLFPVLYFLKNVYISLAVTGILLSVGIIELNIAKRMVNLDENKCIMAYKRGKKINFIFKIILMVIVFILYI